MNAFRLLLTFTLVVVAARQSYGGEVAATRNHFPCAALMPTTNRMIWMKETFATATRGTATFQ